MKTSCTNWRQRLLLEASPPKRWRSVVQLPTTDSEVYYYAHCKKPEEDDDRPVLQTEEQMKRLHHFGFTPLFPLQYNVDSDSTSFSSFTSYLYTHQAICPGRGLSQYQVKRLKTPEIHKTHYKVAEGRECLHLPTTFAQYTQHWAGLKKQTPGFHCCFLKVQ